MTTTDLSPAWHRTAPMRSVDHMWRVCALAVLVVGSVACGSTDSSTDGGADGAAAAAGPAPSAAAQAPDVAGLPDALRFTSPLVGGGSIDGASLAGRPTVLWFWAPT